MKNFRIALFLAALAAGLALGGCALGPEHSLFGDGRVTAASVNQLFNEGERFEAPDFERVDLLAALDPEGKIHQPPYSEYPGSNLEKAYYVFGEPHAPKAPVALARRRDVIQDRILQASEQRCNLFKTYLSRLDRQQNFILGSATTLLGGMGAVFTNAGVARALAGAAGATSGIRAEFNEAFFSSLATSVISPAIERRRARIRQEILNNRRKKDIHQYTVQAAIMDAVRYHGACSVDAGIDEAGAALQRSDS